MQMIRTILSGYFTTGVVIAFWYLFYHFTMVFCPEDLKKMYRRIGFLSALEMLLSMFVSAMLFWPCLLFDKYKEKRGEK